MFATQCFFFTDHLKHKIVIKTTCRVSSKRSFSTVSILVQELFNCYDHFFRFSGFPNLFSKVFLIIFKFSWLLFYSNGFSLEHCKQNNAIGFVTLQRYYNNRNIMNVILCLLNFTFFHKISKIQDEEAGINLILLSCSRNMIRQFIKISNCV